MKKNLILVLFLVLALANFIMADVAPDPDEMRVSSDLTINTDEDLSDYRFFVDFMGAVHEIEVKSKAQTVIPSLGGGARYSSGTVLAVPKKNLTGFPEKLTSPNNGEGEKLSQAISGRKIPGVIELTQHRFYRIIKKSERESWSYPVYRIERNENTLVMREDSRIAPKFTNGGGIDFGIYGYSKGLTLVGYIVFIGVPIGLIFLGIWLFRKRGRKLVK